MQHIFIHCLNLSMLKIILNVQRNMWGSVKYWEELENGHCGDFRQYVGFFNIMDK